MQDFRCFFVSVVVIWRCRHYGGEKVGSFVCLARKVPQAVPFQSVAHSLRPIESWQMRSPLISTAYVFLPPSQRGFFRFLSQEPKSSPLDSVTCALFAQNTRVYPCSSQFGTPAARPSRSWSLATGRRFALPAVSSYNKPCLFRSKSSLPSSQPFLRHPAHGDVSQCY